MTASNPINRIKQLKPLSREHHHGLLLCWKIKTGFSKGVNPQRIKTYADWFYKQYLVPHFEAEEKYVFPILGNDNEFIRKAIEEHRLLSGLFSDKTNIEDSLKQIQTELDKHIRFEERTLFNEIQNAATTEQLKQLEQNLSEEEFTENLSDEFWK